MTKEKFLSLPRNADGDIINLSSIWYELTQRQRNAGYKDCPISSDDFSRIIEYELEAEAELAAFLKYEMN